MHDVAPSAVRMADAIDAMICTTHFNVSFLVIRFTFSYSAVSLRRSPWVWRQSTVACDFTSGPDPSIHCAPDFTSGPDPSKQFKAR